MFKFVQGEKVSDGAGVKLNRIIGSKGLDSLDPFLMLDEFRSDDKADYSAGFPMHPHRGMDTITYMVKGRFTHRDSKGNEGILKSGEVQWMTAGKGLLHEEMPAMEDGELWGYQLWVNLPSKLKMVEPKYRHLKSEDIPVVENEGIRVKVISGIYDNAEGSIEPYFPVDYFDVNLENGIFEKELKTTNAIYVHTGSITISSEKETLEVTEGNLCVIEEVEAIKIQGRNAGFLFISSEPLKEPVAKYGPFVMNTVDEIIQAVDDFNEGLFDK